MTVPINPFPGDADRSHIWQRLIVADSEAFAAGNWKMIENDFDGERFEGVRAMNSANPAEWQIVFPTLFSYRDNWLAASMEFRRKKFVGISILEALFARCSMSQIIINENRALAIKKFCGRIECEDGSAISENRQTVYRLHCIGENWKIAGFLGFLPL